MLAHPKRISECSVNSHSNMNNYKLLSSLLGFEPRTATDLVFAEDYIPMC